jgi:hypothetical protein
MFPLIDVTEVPERDETIGSKTKFWFRREGKLWLFKQARAGTGEDWAEKLAAEVAALLELPHAVVELAVHGQSRGIVSLDFTEGHAKGHLAHGNELLFEADPGYPEQKTYRVREHTLTAVRAVLGDERITLPGAAWPSAVTTAWDAFLGYLLLDALIGNTDRHHQNWGVLASSRESEPERMLAPTYDHASSLGRELSDEARTQRLVTKDRRADVAAYVARARSAFYDERGATLDPVTAFRRAAETSPAAGLMWLDRLRNVDKAAWALMVAEVPGPTMSDPARQFALALLHRTQELLEATRV